MWKCENDLRNRGTTPEVVAVCISPGGVPKTVMDSAEVTVDGLVGDGHDHEKHARPHRALTIQDIELLTELEAEGFDVGPGIMGENLTVRGLHVQQMSPGDQLVFENGPLIELTEVRRPCFVLDKVHPELKRAVVGRCGFLARVLKTGRFFSGQRIHVNENKHETENKKIHKQVNAAGEYSARSPSPRITIRGRQTQSPHVFTIKGAAHG